MLFFKFFKDRSVNKLFKKLGFRNFDYTEGIKFHQNSNLVSCKNVSSNFIFTFGSIGPSELMAHSHANSLSFELSLDNQKVFVNSGVSSYQNQKRRDIERATSSHNTLELNGKNSSDVWASFRCGKRANSKLIKILLQKMNYVFMQNMMVTQQFLKKNSFQKNYLQ